MPTFRKRLSILFEAAWRCSRIGGAIFTNCEPATGPGCYNKVYNLKRAVNGDHSVRVAAVFVEANIGTIEIETAIRLITDLAAQRREGKDFPIRADAASYLTVGEHSAIQPRISVRITKIIAHAKIRFLEIATGVEREIFRGRKFQTRIWQHRVQDPFAREFPANARAGNYRILSLDINTDADDELQVRTVNVCAADEKRHIKIAR